MRRTFKDTFKYATSRLRKTTRSLGTVPDRVFPHEYSQQIPDDLFCKGLSPLFPVLSRELLMSYQSGQSLIEHSYKADSDLSPAGWEYAERLKEFVLERRAKSLEQRGLNPQDRKLVVCVPNITGPGGC
jgi:hypothetical protein